MWYVKIFLLFVFIVVILLFALANKGQEVFIRWWTPRSAGSPVDLVVVLFAAYILGALTFLVISAFREMRLRGRCRRLERDSDRMRRELDALRVASLDGPLAGPQGGSDAGAEGRPSLNE